MNNQTPSTPDRITAQEIRDLFAGMSEEIEELRERIIALNNNLHVIQEGLSHASRPAPAANNTATFIATAIEHERAKGKDTFKMTGPKYAKFGVRVWPEVLEALGFNLDEIARQDKTEIVPPIEVKVELRTYTDEEGVVHANSPRKVLGRA